VPAAARPASPHALPHANASAEIHQPRLELAVGLSFSCCEC
jgi:hypothetical protein